MIKFVKNLTMSEVGIKQARAEALASGTQIEQQDLMNSLKREVLRLENKLTKLNDLAPATTVSLRPGENFDPKAWASDLQNTKIELLNKRIELDVATETYDEWFTEEAEEEIFTATKPKK